MNNILEIKKHSKIVAKLLAMISLSDNGIECYLDATTTAMALNASRSEILSAIKKDLAKTAMDLFKAQQIINSIKDDKVVEFNAENNTISDVFGATYSKENQEIVISGISFNLFGLNEYTKSDIEDLLAQNIFKLNKKEFNATVLRVVRFEEEKDSVKKAILYPSTVIADKILSVIGDLESKISKFQSSMSFEDRVEFNKTFNRAGISDVIQNSTYIDESGIRQLSSSHKKDAKLEELKILISSNLKTISSVEIDADASIEKMVNLVNQIEKFSINSKERFTLKARKLGNYKARGLYMRNSCVVAEDIRDTSAILHEIGHHIHLTDFEEDKFVNYLINKLSQKIQLEEEQLSKSSYYYEPTEIVARACEIAGLFAQEAGLFTIEENVDLQIIKTRQYYEQFSGIYFQLKTFTDEDKEELISLFKLFFQTKAGSCCKDVDNFIVQPTNYIKNVKTLSIHDLIAKERKAKAQERKALFALVNKENINTIFEKRGDADLIELSTTILTNIGSCGNHKNRMLAEDWAIVIENKAGVVNYIMSVLESSLSNREYIKTLEQLHYVWYEVIENQVLLKGFSNIKFKMSVRKELTKLGREEFDVLYLAIEKYRKPISFAKRDILEDKKYMLEYLVKNFYDIKSINADEIDIDILREYNLSIKNKTIHDVLKGDREFMLSSLEIDNRMVELYASDALRNEVEFMSIAIDKGVSLNRIGDDLTNSFEFMSPFVKSDPKNFNLCSKELQKDLRILALFDNDEREMEEIKDAPASKRRKIARTTNSVKLIEYLAKDKNQEVRAEVARNPICTIDILESLSKLKSEWVRRAVAENDKTPSKVLTRMLKNSDTEDNWVHQAIAENKNITFTTLSKLSTFENSYTRWSVMLNPKVQKAQLSKEQLVKVVSNCLNDTSDDFYHHFKTDDKFYPSYEFLNLFLENITSIIDDGYRDGFQNLAKEMMRATTPTTTVVSEVKEVVESSNDIDSDFEDLVSVDYSSLVENGDIEDFEHSKTHENLKVLKLETKLSKDELKGFIQYLKENSIGYYSKFAKGFILSKEYLDSVQLKVAATTTIAVTSPYSEDMINVFAGGSLF